MTRQCVLAAVLTIVAGCGGGSRGLDLHFDVRATHWDDVVQRVMSAPPPPTQPARLLSISRADPPLLIAHDLQQRELWRSETAANATLHIAGASVVTVEADQLVVRDIATGNRTFATRLSGMSLLGASRDGDTLAWISAAPSISGTEPRSRIVVADARSGSIHWTRDVDAALGAPVLRAGLLIAPWNRQGLTAIDARNGREVARMHAAGLSVEWVEATSTGIVYGTDDVRDLTCSNPHPGCAPLQSPFTSAPSRPALRRSGYRAPEASGIRTVYDVTRSTTGELGYTDDRAYLLFYRYVFAFDPAGSPKWVRIFEPEIMDARAYDGGLAVADATGRTTRLRATDGATLSQSEPIGALRSALWTEKLSAIDNAPRQDAAPSASFQHELLAVLLDADNRLVTARAYAAQTLARDDDAAVTQQLLDAYEQRSTPTGLRSVLAQLLLTRRTGGEHLLAALARHLDFLDDVTSAPLSVVVPALVVMEERRAVPALLEHLHDPGTTADDLLVIADGLQHLGERTTAGSIVAWLRSFRASRALAGHPDVVVALARAAKALAPTDATPALDALGRSDGAEPVFAAAIVEALRVHVDATTAAATVASTGTSPIAQPGLRQEHINAAFADRIDAIRACVVPELSRNPSLAQIRIAFVARPDGNAHGFAFAPAGTAFAACLQSITRGLTLRPFTGEATLARYVIQLRAPAQPADIESEAAADASAEWWSWYAREMPPTDGQPWWSRYVQADHDWLPTEVVATTQTQTTTTATPEVPTPVILPTPAATDDAWWLPAQP